MNQGRNIMSALQFDFQTDVKRLLHQRKSFGIRRVEMLHEQFTTIQGVGQDDHARTKHIIRAEFPRRHDRVSAYHVRHQAVHQLVISNIIAHQFGIGPGQFGAAHPDVAII